MLPFIGGMFLGGAVGVVAMALCQVSGAASRAEEELERVVKKDYVTSERKVMP